MNAFARAFEDILSRAYEVGASDVHIEPHADHVLVRARVDGRMEAWERLEDDARRRRWMEVMKRGCNLDMSRIGAPQDVRFGTEEPPCDYRVALVPGVDGGEKLVLRLLPRTTSFDLGTYRMPDAAKADLRTALTKRDGLILVSGPTGSGKSTLLYNALDALDPSERTIYTLEDPVEYRLPGLWQCQVDRSRGVGFVELLRAMMRADPDVMLVGEVRDEETAEAAFHAAKTGHLVLSTVHANDAAGVAERMTDLGVSPATFDATVRFVSAQRLVPRLCEACREEDPQGAMLVSAALGPVERAFRVRGCDACRGLGTKGRLLLMGWLSREVTADGRSHLVPKNTLRSAAREAVEKGVIRAVDAVGY
jgi:type II secretory ATPase GspE/PulE/Tfp pilus assembly ATPase PilB-like protein